MHGQTAIKSSIHTGRHQMVPPATTVMGKVAKVGFYRDTLPLLIITIKKEEAAPLPFRIGERVPVAFVINGHSYIAGLRATANSSTVMICSDLSDKDLNTMRLVDLLFSQGWRHKDSRLALTIKKGAIYCL